MKILIIGTPRSGTTSLIKGLGKTKNYQRYGEPWNKYIGDRYPRYPYPYNFNSECVVKTLIENIPAEFENLKGLTFSEKLFKFYNELKLDFDRIILLGRKNLNEQIRSYTYFREKELIDSKVNWHDNYILPDSVDLPTEKFKKEIYRMDDRLKKLSEILNIDIDWYEELYSGDLDNVKIFVTKHNLDLDLDKFYEYLNPKNRQRITKLSVI